MSSPSTVYGSVSGALYNRFAPLIQPISRRIGKRCPASIGIEDLEQFGRIALWQACVQFEPAKEASFPTYVKVRIHGAMLDSIRGTEFREASRERDAVRLDDAILAPNLQPLAAGPQRDPFVTRAVQQLGGRQAAVIGLRFYAGLSRAEAGARIGISVSAVGRAERAGIATLRGLLRAA
jgi:RNA polymerase sigma factor (sigma-70 family)